MKTNLLQVNQKIHCILYGGQDGYIKEIKGEQTPETIEILGGVCHMGGSADIIVRFSNGHESNVPECIVRGVQWQIGEILTPEQVKQIDKDYLINKLAKQTAFENKQIADKKEQNEMPAKYPYLHPMTDKFGNKKGVMDNIRLMLKNNFPGIKFSVVNEHYSTVYVRWTDGPTNDEVDNLVSLFEDHHTDETGDFSDYHPSNFNDIFGGMQYVFCTRSMSKETESAITEQGKELYNTDNFSCHCAENFTHHIFSHCSLPAGAIVTGIIKKDVNSGIALPETFYTLSFEVPQQTKPTLNKSDNIEIRINEEKNGIEILFPSKPSEIILTSLKSSGFRWSGFNKVWYNKNTPENLNFANSLTDEPAKEIKIYEVSDNNNNKSESLKEPQYFPISTREQRRQLRLDRAAKTHARNTKRGNTARYY